MDTASVNTQLVATGIIIGTELKKAVEEKHNKQAILKLVAASHMSGYPVTESKRMCGASSGWSLVE